MSGTRRSRCRVRREAARKSAGRANCAGAEGREGNARGARRPSRPTRPEADDITSAVCISEQSAGVHQISSAWRAGRVGCTLLAPRTGRNQAGDDDSVGRLL